jgi:hypothetical protein
MANSRKKKNFIHSLMTANEVVVTQEEKSKVIFDHFFQHLGSYEPRTRSLKLNNLGWQPKDLHHLELPILTTELHQVILDAPKEKSPGPDGFIGIFFSLWWDIIKIDLMNAVQHFFTLNQKGLHLLNQAFIVLIPKKANPQRITDFSPISLIHSFAKMISKILANRLAPMLPSLISNNQMAFIKKRCIHDSFIYVQEVVRGLHKKKISSLFIKLDISKAFNTVS